MSSRDTQGAELSRRTLAVAIGMALTAGSAHAGTIAVTNTNDAGAGSLREAIATANGAAGADTIDFSGVSGQTITLASDLTLIEDNLTLQGSDVTLDGDSQFTCLAAYDASLTVNDMTVSNCTGQRSVANRDDRGSTFTYYGGGVYVGYGNLEINDSVITGNAVRPSSGPNPYELVGGGVAVKYGSLSVVDSAIEDNEAVEGGGIFHFGSPPQLYRGTTDGSLTLSGSTISGNTAFEGGGGVISLSFSSPATVDQSEIVDNQSDGYGGGLGIYGGGSALAVSNSTISGNSAVGAVGGASLYNKYPGTTTLLNNTISNNSASQNAGLIVRFDAGGQPPPPPPNVNGQLPAPVMLTGQTITGNTSSSGPGGGLTVSFSQPETVLVANSIVQGNTAAVGSDDLSASTSGPNLRNRLAQRRGRASTQGGPPPSSATTFDVDFSVIGEAPTDASTFDPDTVTTNLLGQDPLLEPLAENGGPTQTHLPGTGSPAVDIVTGAGGCGASFDMDQRGEPRPESGGTLCDAGSVEVAGAPMIDVDPDVAFGNVLVGDTAGPGMVTLANTGSSPLEVAGFSATAPFTLDFSDCAPSLPFSVAAGDSCLLAPSFSPTSAGTFNQTVTVASDSATGGDNSFALSGTGVTAGISAAPLDFGTLPVGDSAQDTVTVTNTGQGDLSISNLVLSDDAGGAFGLVGDDCNAPVTSGNSCNVTISFSPTAGGPFSGSLAISSNATAQPLEVALTGQGAVGELAITPAGGLNFGNVPIGQDGTASLTLSNIGDGPIDLTGWTAPAAPFSIVGGSCPTPPFALAAGESCTLTFSFSPTDPVDYDESLDFSVDNGAGGSTVPVSVAGSGVAQAVSVPTLNHIGLVIGGGLLALLGLFGLRRRDRGGLSG